MRPEPDLRTDFAADDYEAAFSAFVERFRGDVATVAVGRFGHWGHPGVSDLDGLLVVDDGALARLTAEARRWAGEGDRRRYLFWHPPLVLSRALLAHAPWLHSLDGVGWTVPPPEPLPEPPPASRRHLDLVWATYLLVVGARMRFAGLHPGLRAVLLVLKNLHSAVGRMQPGDDDALARSAALRGSCLQAARPDAEQGERRAVADAVGTEFAAALDAVSAGLDRWRSPDAPEWGPGPGRRTGGRRSVRVRKEVVVARGGPTAVEPGRPITVRAAPAAFDAVFAPWRGSPTSGGGVGGSEAGREYHARVRAAAAVVRREGAPWPFVRPFDWRVEDLAWRRALRRLAWALGR